MSARKICIAAWLSVISYHATAFCQATPNQIRQLPTQYFTIADDALRDSVSPTIEVEQVGDNVIGRQGYRIQIFSDGRVFYFGNKYVKTLGEVQSHITRNQVEKILNSLRLYRFWDVSIDQYSRASPPNWMFTIRKPGAAKSVRVDGRGLGMLWLKTIEDEVKSEKWRCPYHPYQGEEQELCSRFEQRKEQAVQTFIDREMYQFMGDIK